MQKIRYQSEKITLPVRGGNAVVAWENPTKLTVTLPYSGAFGMGEKFDSLNQKGFDTKIMIEEKCTFQGEKTYVVSPFFWTDTGFGLYCDTYKILDFHFGDKVITVDLPCEDIEITLFIGKPEEIIREYMGMFGKAVLPPEWVFGPWVSANKWNNQKAIENVVAKLKEYNFPTSVLVIEAWLDPNYFLFTGSKPKVDPTKQQLKYEDIDYTGAEYYDPKGMIDMLHKEGIKLLLWQAPVCLSIPKDAPDYEAHTDTVYQDMIKNRYCVMRNDGKPYKIPHGYWFGGSIVPDFTNPEAVKSWFGMRQYLLDIGIDGFKTDGGEFIHDDDAVMYDGSTGKDAVNRYSKDYTEAYQKFIGKDRILFSRAGCQGQHLIPLLWGGDQQSKNCEMKSVLNAGLEAALTGIPFWGFDIAGFARDVPTIDLYRRGTQMGCFCPIMQWHSEPRFDGYDNERSPWHVAELGGDMSFVDEVRYWYDLRMKLIPYITETAKNCVETYRPMMRPLVYDWSDDPKAVECDDEYMFGDDLLVCPLLEENAESREVYLPDGEWINVFDKKRYNGKRTIVSGGDKKLPVFVRANSESKFKGIFD